MTLSAHDVLTLARKHVGDNATMESSARVALADAVKLYDEGELTLATERATRSLAYSVGVLSPAYQRAARARDAMRTQAVGRIRYPKVQG